MQGPFRHVAYFENMFDVRSLVCDMCKMSAC